MNGSIQLEQELQRLVQTGGDSLRAAFDNGEFEADVVHCDRLAISLSEVRFLAPRLAGAANARLAETADRLAAKLTYLLEPLRIIECDGAAGAIQMRSHPPHRTPESVRYYEILVSRSGKISIARYEKQAGEPRRRVPAHLTHEVLLRIADDCQSAVV